MNETEFTKHGEYVIEEICKKFKDPKTKIMFAEAAEIFLNEFKSYLFKKESEGK